MRRASALLMAVALFRVGGEAQGEKRGKHEPRCKDAQGTVKAHRAQLAKDVSDDKVQPLLLLLQAPTKLGSWLVGSTTLGLSNPNSKQQEQLWSG